MKPTFITHFDHNYFPHGMAMSESLRRVAGVDHCTVLALTPECERLVEDNGRWVIHPLVHLEEYLRGEGFDIDRIKQERTWKEYCWTLEPAWVDYQLDMSMDGEQTFYCDSDLFFFSSPLQVKPPHPACIGLTRHHFPFGKEEKEDRVGRFNFGYAWFMACPESRKVVRRWLEQTMERCDGREAGHQRYLDEWPTLLGDGFVELHPGENVGPWRKPICPLGNVSGQPGVRCGEHGFILPLTSFHFHEHRRGTGRNPITLNGQQWNRCNYEIAPSTITNIYEPYEIELSKYL